MSSVERLVPALQRLFTTVAEEAAQRTACCRRASGTFTGASLCQTLVFGVLAQPLPHLRSWCQAAAGIGIQVSPQAIDQRLNARTADMLEAVLSHAIRDVVTAEPVAVPLLERFAGVYVQDCTQSKVPAALHAPWPGCGNQAGETATVKRGVRLELTRGALQGPTVVPGRVHDRDAVAALPPLPAGSLRVADLGFFSVPELAAHAATGAYFLTRVQGGTSIITADGTQHTLRSLRRRRRQPVDLAVELGAQQRLPCRLLAVRVPPAVAAQRRRRMTAEAKRRGQPIHPERWALAGWTILATHAPRTLRTIPEALVLLRRRWQIELLFKGWKSGSRQIATWRTTQAEKRRCAFFAKLVAAVLDHWFLVTSCWHLVDRSLAQARVVVQSGAAALLAALATPDQLIAVLGDLARRCALACRTAPRSDQPAAFQLLCHPERAEDWMTA